MLLDGLEPELHSGGTGRSGASGSNRSWASGPGAGGDGARAGSYGLGSDGNGSGTGLSWGLRNGARTSSNGPGAGSNGSGRLGSDRGGPGLEVRVEDGEGSGTRSSGLLNTSTTEVDERLLEGNGSGLSLDLLHLRLGGSSGLRLGKVDSGYGRSRSHGTR